MYITSQNTVMPTTSFAPHQCRKTGSTVNQNTNPSYQMIPCTIVIKLHDLQALHLSIQNNALTLRLLKSAYFLFGSSIL